jgi:Zn-dependent protease with chaperone function
MPREESVYQPIPIAKLCPRCNEPLDAALLGSHVATCRYCGHRFVVQAEAIVVAVPTGQGETFGPAILNRLRDPGEQRARTWLLVAAVPVWIALGLATLGSLGGLLLVVGLLALASHLGELAIAAHIKANAIEVGPKQLPELHATVLLCAARLGITAPTVYVLQDSAWNALAMKLAGRRMVVLLSGAVDSLLQQGDLSQLAFVVGHELGHHACGHLELRHRFLYLGGWLPPLLLWYRRRCELTCDRIGLHCAGNLQASLTALANMTVGAHLAQAVNIDTAIDQWERYRQETFVRWRTLYASHPPKLWRLAALQAAAPILGPGV